jgi:Cu+-exporting ATPase
MTLEPVKVTADVGENHQLADMTRRFRVGLILTLPIFLLEMGGHIRALGLHEIVPPGISSWIQFTLATPVVCGPGGHSSSARGRQSRTAALTCSA